jgi:hypothetical protein
MKKLLLTIFSYLIATQLFAQTTEFSFGINGGLMHFSGPSSASSTFITEGPENYTNNPYGNKNGLGFGGYIQGQYVTKTRIIAGLQIGVDALKSKVDITEAHLSAYPLYPIKTTGTSNISSHYINTNPYVGYRFPISKITLDAIAGLEIAYVADAYDEGSAKNKTGESFITTNRGTKTINTDTRIKVGLSAHYDRLGLYVNYAHGLSNYATGIGVTAGGGSSPNGAHTEIMRLGINCIVF